MSDFSGMTVNERLVVSGLIDQFDNMVADRNIDGVRKILQQVDLSEESILPILKNLRLIE